MHPQQLRVSEDQLDVPVTDTTTARQVIEHSLRQLGLCGPDDYTLSEVLIDRNGRCSGRISNLTAYNLPFFFLALQQFIGGFGIKYMVTSQRLYQSKRLTTTFSVVTFSLVGPGRTLVLAFMHLLIIPKQFIFPGFCTLAWMNNTSGSPSKQVRLLFKQDSRLTCTGGSNGGGGTGRPLGLAEAWHIDCRGHTCSFLPCRSTDRCGGPRQ